MPAGAFNIRYIFNLPPTDCLICLSNHLNQNVIIGITYVKTEFFGVPVTAEYLDQLFDVISRLGTIDMQYFHFFVAHYVLLLYC